MAFLTGDQIIVINNDSTFLKRVEAVLLTKAQYWINLTTATRAEVNRRTQKRKRLARTITTSSNWTNSMRAQVAQYWLGWYAASVDPAALDGDGLPTYTTIYNNFDATWDNFSSVLVGDETETEIEW